MQLFLKRKYGSRPPSGAGTLGTSFHKAAQVNFEEKALGGLDAPVDVCTDAMRDEFHERLLDTNWKEDEKPNDLLNNGVAMVKAVHDDMWPYIYPKNENSIERYVKLDCGNFFISGIVDLQEAEDEAFIDWKTASRRWARTKAAKEIQGFLYPLAVMLEDGLEFEVEETPDGTRELLLPLKFGVTTLKGDSELHEVRHSLEQGRTIIGMARHLIEMLRKSNPIANPDNFLCSRKWCAYFDFCPVMKGELLDE